MGFVNDYRTASELEQGAEASEHGANKAFFMSFHAEQKAAELGNGRGARFWKKQARKEKERMSLCNNRGKNLRSLLGRKLKKLKKKR